MTRFEIALLLEPVILLALLICVGRMYRNSTSKPKWYKFTTHCLGFAGLSLLLLYGVMLGQWTLYKGNLFTGWSFAPVRTHIYDSPAPMQTTPDTPNIIMVQGMPTGVEPLNPLNQR